MAKTSCENSQKWANLSIWQEVYVKSFSKVESNHGTLYLKVVIYNSHSIHPEVVGVAGIEPVDIKTDMSTDEATLGRTRTS